MYEDRRNSFSLVSSLYSAFLYILDCCLSLFIVPVNGVAFWITVEKFLEKIPNFELQAILTTCCTIVFVLVHIGCKSFYRFIKRYTVSTYRFFIVSKLYIYIASACGTVVYAGILEARYSNIPGIDDPFTNCLVTVVSFAALFGLKCYPHLADFGSDIGSEATPEDVFLFPYRLFNFSVRISNFDHSSMSLLSPRKKFC